MPRKQNQKQKVLRLAQILHERTDEAHVLSADELIACLEEYGIQAERKSIYTDIEALCQCGFDIERQGGRGGGYYLANRMFEQPELKLLVDAVQSSRFITHRKSHALINKVERLASSYQARALQRQVYVSGRIKTMNESIYYNIDRIHSAIAQGKQICFRYFEWTITPDLQVKKQFRRDGAQYTASPWALVWNSENYYLVAYDPMAAAIRHYRVDKMEQIGILDAARQGKEQFERQDVGQYAKHLFGMFGGAVETVVLRCENRLAGVMHDRFGGDMMLLPEDEAHFRMQVEVAVSPQLFGWLCGLGAGVQIAEPKAVADQYRAYLQQVLKGR